MNGIRRLLVIFGLLLVAGGALPAHAFDLDKAKDIYGPCAACHGEFGAGGKKGVQCLHRGNSLRKGKNGTRKGNLAPFRRRKAPGQGVRVLAEFRKEAACGAAGLPGKPLEKEETEGKAFRFSITNRAGGI